jgi:hypothetical protein
MSRSIFEIAKILSVNAQQVENWASLFNNYLSPDTGRTAGGLRVFSDSDFLVFVYLSEYWGSDPDIESIESGLNQENHHDERFVERLYLHTPLLQEPPDDLDETWRHGVLWVGGHGQERFELARNYRYAAEKMLEQALQTGEVRNWMCPVLFAYRHTLELYLKCIGSIGQRTHSLTDCAKLVEKHHGMKLDSQVKSWIEEFDKIDPNPGTAFRYEDEKPNKAKLDYTEYWMDFQQLKFVMGKVFQMIDMAVLRTNCGGTQKQPNH